MGSDLQSLTELRGKQGLLGNRAVFTDAERAHCVSRPDPAQSYAGLLCAKEACFKALSDFTDRPPFSFLDLEIGHDPAGRPRLQPGARLAPWMTAAAVTLDLTISHSAAYATATAVVVRGIPAPPHPSSPAGPAGASAPSSTSPRR